MIPLVAIFIVVFLNTPIKSLIVPDAEKEHFAECGVAKIERGLRDDNNATFEGEHPWMVAILRDGKFACAGILISNLEIITAARCTLDLNPKPRFLRYIIALHRYISITRFNMTK